MTGYDRYERPDDPPFVGEVIGGTFSYHRPTCHVIPFIEKRNYKRLQNWQAAVALGLSRCGVCAPQPPSVPTIDDAQVEISAVGLGPMAPPGEVEPALNRRTSLTANQVADHRRALMRLLDALDDPANRTDYEGAAARIERLKREGTIPRYVVACMRTITEMRNAAEYDGKKLSAAESCAVEGCWAAIFEWATSRGISVPGWTPDATNATPVDPEVVAEALAVPTPA